MGAYNPAIDNPLDDLASQAGNTFNDAASAAGRFANRLGANVASSLKQGVGRLLGDKGPASQPSEGATTAVGGGGGARAALSQLAGGASLTDIAANAAKEAAINAIKKRLTQQAVRAFITANMWWIGPTLGVIIVLLLLIGFIYMAYVHFSNNPMDAVWDCGLGVAWSDEAKAECVLKAGTEGVESVSTGYEEGASLQDENI